MEEIRNPSLKGKPLGVTQKYIIVTSNYAARSRGVTKLMGIKDAQTVCPDINLVCLPSSAAYVKVGSCGSVVPVNPGQILHGLVSNSTFRSCCVPCHAHPVNQAQGPACLLKSIQPHISFLAQFSIVPFPGHKASLALAQMDPIIRLQHLF